MGAEKPAAMTTPNDGGEEAHDGGCEGQEYGCECSNRAYMAKLEQHLRTLKRLGNMMAKRLPSASLARTWGHAAARADSMLAARKGGG